MAPQRGQEFGNHTDTQSLSRNATAINVYHRKPQTVARFVSLFINSFKLLNKVSSTSANPSHTGVATSYAASTLLAFPPFRRQGRDNKCTTPAPTG